MLWYFNVVQLKIYFYCTELFFSAIKESQVNLTLQPQDLTMCEEVGVFKGDVYLYL